MDLLNNDVASCMDHFDNIHYKKPSSQGSGLPTLGPGGALPIANIPSVSSFINQCNKPICDDADMQCIVDLIDGTICEALAIIESDPRGLFIYNFPKRQKMSSISMDSSAFTDSVVANGEDDPSTTNHYMGGLGTSADSVSSGLARKMLTIGDFEYSNAIADIRDFVSRWELSPDTKCVVISNPIRHEVPKKGTILFVDAHFSRPTPRCPNPLAVAKVRFIISLSKILLKHYPVMITYRFEGYNTLYYGLGERCLNSFTFQRFYIDTILHTKLTFFAAISECRHGTIEKPKNNIKTKNTKKSGY
ncbi:uncharacterized protein LOC6528658 [Drosophila yakuba]|uniref:Uncharacterized protein n=1 Tax=Drosophila yakuba TaxID=7245 RepID=B4P3D9_DROYA|nr:uncharacterized protein LOC6528658 [Drosophila yakuba]EDW89412.1 uncharacterized protein Dyak_GE22735 [Drosophila yakuba]